MGSTEGYLTSSDADESSEAESMPSGMDAAQLAAMEPAATIFHAQKCNASMESLLKKEEASLQILATKFEHVREEMEATAADSMFHPCWDQIQHLSLPDHVSKLRHSDRELRVGAAHQIRVLARKPAEIRTLIADCGAIPPLVSMTASADDGEVSESVLALLNISIESQRNRWVIAAYEAVPLLVKLLQTANWEIREDVAATLYSLSLLDNNKIIIGAEGAIPPMVQILQNGSEQGKNDALKSLFSLSVLSTNKLRVLEAAGVQLFLEFIRDNPKSSMAAKSASVLANLASIVEGRNAIEKEAKGLELIVGLLEFGSDRGKEDAMEALWQFLKSDSDYISKIKQFFVLPPLQSLSITGRTEDAKKKVFFSCFHSSCVSFLMNLFVWISFVALNWKAKLLLGILREN